MFVAVDYLQMSEDELEENSLDERKLLHLNNVYKSFTRIVHEYGGEIRDLLFDDKGCVFIAVFGAHNVIELPELKCMRAAIKMSSTHKRVKIGVDVGKCFTGEFHFYYFPVLVEKSEINSVIWKACAARRSGMISWSWAMK